MLQDKHFEELFNRISSFLEDDELQADEAIKYDIKLSFLSLHAVEQADIISELKYKQRAQFISIVSNDIDAEILTYLDKAILLDFPGIVGKEVFGKMISLLSVNDAVDVLDTFPKEEKKELIDFVQYKKRIKIKQLLSYPKDSVGRNMNTDFLSISEIFTIKQATEYLYKNIKSVELELKNINLFVKNREGRVVGTVSILDLLKAKQDDIVSKHLHEIKHFVNTYEDISETAESFIEYNLQIIPVLDVNSKMVGVLELNDIANLIKEKTEKSLLMTAGVFEAKKEGVVGLAKARFTWLFVNFITASIASSVITIFEPLVASFAVLATLTPIVASIGGNTGNQSSAVIIRSLAVKDFEASEVINEMATALLNSILFSLIAFILSYVLHHNFLLSLSFGLAIFVNINVGAIIGSSVPVLISKLKIDPALCSSIFVPMMTDMIGFFSFLGISYLLFTSI